MTGDRAVTRWPTWIDVLRRDLLEPYRALAVRHPFHAQLAAGTLPRPLLERYITDTLWAVRDFSRMSAEMAERAPAFYLEEMGQIAKEEESHPRMLGHVALGLGIDPEGILAEDGRYRPTPIYELWWSWIQTCARHLPWADAIAAVMVGVEDLARVQEAIVGKALIEHYGLLPKQAAWFVHHGGEDEAEHGNLGLSILGRAVAADDAQAHARARRIVERSAAPLLFHYHDHLLGRAPLVGATGGLASPAGKQLEALGIAYRVVAHPAGVRSAEDFAQAVGAPIERVFKTLVLADGRGGHLLLSLPSNRQVDLDKLGAITGGAPKLTSLAEASKITGYEPYCVSPFGRNAPLPYYVDDSLFTGETVLLGSGSKGADIELTSLALLEGLRPHCVDVLR